MIDNYDDQSRDDVEYRHDRYDQLADSADALDSAQQNGADEYDKNNAYNPCRNMECADIAVEIEFA